MAVSSVLVLNAGSSSLKYQVVDPASGTTRAKGHVDRIETSDFARALREMTDRLAADGIDADALDAVGHRVVHGGARVGGPPPPRDPGGPPSAGPPPPPPPPHPPPPAGPPPG